MVQLRTSEVTPLGPFRNISFDCELDSERSIPSEWIVTDSFLPLPNTLESLVVSVFVSQPGTRRFFSPEFVLCYEDHTESTVEELYFSCRL